MTRQWFSSGMAVLLAASNFLFLAILMVFVWLKEDPMFWLNAGGWPIWLRELVLITFYPLLIVEFGALIVFSRGCLQWRKEGGEVARAGYVAVSLFWILYLVVVGMLVTDNVENLLEGRDFHAWNAEAFLPADISLISESSLCFRQSEEAPHYFPHS